MPQIVVKFSKEERAKKYSSGLKDIGLSITTKIKPKDSGGFVVVVVSKSADDIKVAKSLYNDISDGTDKKVTKKVVDKVKECVEQNKGKTLQLRDGSLVRLTPSDAKLFINTHDDLTESSQLSFLLMLAETKESFNAVIQFCKESSTVINTDICHQDYPFNPQTGLPPKELQH